MSSKKFDLQNSWRWRIVAFLLLIRAQSFGLNTDGILLLSFKYSIIKDSFGVLQGWNYHDETPCSWNGVSCGGSALEDTFLRVTGLSLPDSGLVGSIPATMGMIEHLRELNLSNNSINGSIPYSLFGASELRILDLSNNLISGGLPELVGKLRNLQVLNLSDNALFGTLPVNLSTLPNVTDVSFKNNYFFGLIPGGFNSVRVLDLSSNLITGSLPADFGGANLAYLNVSFNRLAGEIPQEFATKIPVNASLDLSFNNLTGPIPESDLFLNQDTKSFSGNPELCGKPLKKLCPVSSSTTTPANASAPPNSPPAIAAMPKSTNSNPATASPTGAAAESPSQGKRTGLQTGTILGIVIGDIAGIGILALIFTYVNHRRKRKNRAPIKKEAESEIDFDWASSASSSEEYNWLRTWTCLKKQRQAAAEDDEEQETTSESTNSDTENQEIQKKGELVTVDGEKELELETLLKASAYILGASGSSIMYKAVLEDGTTLAVRRIGENGVERFRDFKNQVRVIAKLVHPNLVRIRGFYWGADEKLIIYDFVPNGSLANARYRKAGSSPCHLPWEIRLKIAKGVARGLNYIHEKKHVHGNLKPTNILLGHDMEPKIGDFGLERLVTGDSSSKAGGSCRHFGSKRSTASRESFPDATPSPSPSVIGVSPYHAPESLRSLKPNPKWDVFSFGVVFLELLTGKVIVSDETGPSLAVGSSTLAEDKGKVLKMADVAIRAEMEGKEDALLALLKLGYGCISPAPQKRPSMKEVIQALERFPTHCFGQ